VKLEDLPDVLTAAELAEIYRCSKETIRRKTESGLFPRIPGFHELLYRKVDILDLLGHKAPPRTEDDDVEAPPCGY
jgi:hypothetical protein